MEIIENHNVHMNSSNRSPPIAGTYANTNANDSMPDEVTVVSKRGQVDY